MKQFLLILAILLVGSLTFFSRSAFAQRNVDGSHISGQVLVKFRPGTDQNLIVSEAKKHGGQVVDRIASLGVTVLQVPSVAENRIVTALAQNPRVEYAELNYVAEALLTVNDPGLVFQWGLENANDADIDATEAWDVTQGNGIKIAILDTGISSSHLDLAGQVVYRSNLTDSGTDDDVYGHGTHVGGIVAGLTNNGLGGAGVCPNCELLSIKVLNDSGSGAYSWIANGITEAVAQGAQVINLSLGGPTKSRTLEDAVNYAWDHGVVVVAAAGNSGNQSKTYPAAYPNAIAVAATDNLDHKATFSEYGSWVDVAAPGVSIYSTWNDNSSPSNPQPECLTAVECYKYASGTSMSTPMAAGVVGLIWSTGQYPTAADVRSRLEMSAEQIPGTGTYWSAGRINAAQAVGSYVAPSPTVTPKPGKNR